MDAKTKVELLNTVTRVQGEIITKMVNILYFILLELDNIYRVIEYLGVEKMVPTGVEDRAVYIKASSKYRDFCVEILEFGP